MSKRVIRLLDNELEEEHYAEFKRAVDEGNFSEAYYRFERMPQVAFMYSRRESEEGLMKVIDEVRESQGRIFAYNMKRTYSSLVRKHERWKKSAKRRLDERLKKIEAESERQNRISPETWNTVYDSGN